VVRSADRRSRTGGCRFIFVVVTAGVAAVSLSGCVSTQTKAARVRVNSARIRASQVHTRVTHAGSAVRVRSLALVTTRHRTRFVVSVRNESPRTISDLPISIGYRTRAGKRIYLNAGVSSGYFDAHLATVAGRATQSWVSAVTRSLPKGAHPFALVGARPSVSADDTGSLPVITATQHGASATSLQVSVHNGSSIPQYQLPVYAVVRHDGRATAAAQATVTELSGGATQVLHLRLLGSAGHATATVQAPPTIVQ
jgi:hypothetical protein